MSLEIVGLLILAVFLVWLDGKIDQYRDSDKGDK